MARAATLEEIRSGPVSPSDRINSIDALRGIALFGVLAINVVTIFRVSIFERFLFHQPTGSPIDSAVQTILMLAVDLKALARRLVQLLPFDYLNRDIDKRPVKALS